MQSKRLVGWFLVIVGVVIIIWTLYLSFQIFTGAAEAPQLFSFKQSPADSQPVKSPTGELLPQEIINQVLSQQLEGFLPADSSVKLFNLMSWSILAGIMLFGAGQIAGIGVKILSKE